MSWSTKAWLKGFGLEQYYSNFIENGYETQKLCANLKDEDLDGMDITNQGHRSVLLNQSDLLKIALSSTSSSIGNESPEVLSTENSPRLPSRDQSDGVKLKPRSSSTSQTEKLSNIIDTNTYTTVFDDVVDTKKMKKKKIRSPKAPPKRTDGKSDKLSRKIHKLDDSISEVPTTLASISPQAMTKLQLKVRIKDMVARDNIVLSNSKYCSEEGMANEIMLIEVAEKFSEELGLEGLEVLDAVKDVWRYANNEKSEFVLTKSNPSTPGTGSSVSGASFNEVFEQSNYSEPFDATTSGSTRPPKLTPRKISTDIANRGIPPITTPPLLSSGNYAQPFDAIPVSNQPVIVKTSPEKKHKTIQLVTTPKQSFSTSHESLAVEKRTSKTLPPQGSPNLSARSSSSEDSPYSGDAHSPRRKKQWNLFNRSGKTDQMLMPESAVPLPGLNGKKKGSTSAENLTKITDYSMGTKRKSLPPSEFAISPGLPRSISSNPALLYQQCLTEEGSKKNITESQESLNELQSNLQQQIPLEQKVDEDTEEFKVTSRVKGLTVTNRAASELELSNMLEVYVEGCDKPVKFQRYQEIEATKDEKKKSLLRRLFHKRKSKDSKNKSITEEVTSVSSDTNEDKKGLTSSTSLPDIATAAATVHSEYAEVFDVEPGSTPSTPPKLPSRNRPHSAKTPRRIMPSYGSSPSASPITHHKLMIKSDSLSSNEVIHSTPTTSNKDDVIEISIPNSTYEEPIIQPTEMTARSEQLYDNASNVETVSNEISSQSGPNRYDDPWKPILRPKPRSRKGRASSSDSRGASEEPDIRNNKPPIAPKPRVPSGEHVSTPSSQSSLSPNHDVFFSPSHSPSKSAPPPKPSRMRGLSKTPSPEPPIMDANTSTNYTDHLITNSTVDTKPVEHPVPLPRRKINSYSPTRELNNDIVKTNKSTSSVENDNDQCTPLSPQKPPKPLRQKHGVGASKPISLSGNLLQIALEEKLSKENIDLTVPPYSSQRGEYGIPSALVSRYSEEFSSLEDDVVKILDKIRRTCLLKARRAHIPLKKDWKKYSAIEATSMEKFLTSVGLPQYYNTFVSEGFVSVMMLKSRNWNSLPLEETHKTKLSTFIKQL